MVATPLAVSVTKALTDAAVADANLLGWASFSATSLIKIGLRVIAFAF